MNAKQLSKLITITNKINKYEKDLNGFFEFNVTKLQDGHVFLFASNASNSEWYMPHNYVCIFVGPRGGVKIGKKSFNPIYIN